MFIFIKYSNERTSPLKLFLFSRFNLKIFDPCKEKGVLRRKERENERAYNDTTDLLMVIRFKFRSQTANLIKKRKEHQRQPEFFQVYPLSSHFFVAFHAHTRTHIHTNVTFLHIFNLFIFLFSFNSHENY